MITLALLVALVPQDEARLKESWPKLVEAFKAVEAYKPTPEAALLDDELLKTAAKLHSALDSAGLMTGEGEYLPQAVKAFLKIRAQGLFTSSGQSFGRVVFARALLAGGGAAPQVDANPMATLLASLKKLQELKAGGLDDEENVQDELSTARKALKGVGVIADDTPVALRRRALHLVKALALGEAYPAPAVATEEQTKQYRSWITDLASESIEARDKASEELRRAGDGALPLLREAIKSGDAEVATRARQLLGYGHAPWTKLTPPRAEGWHVDFAVPVAPAPAAPPK